jgi:hypothetical protein
MQRKELNFGNLGLRPTDDWRAGARRPAAGGTLQKQSHSAGRGRRITVPLLQNRDSRCKIITGRVRFCKIVTVALKKKAPAAGRGLSVTYPRKRGRSYDAT